MAIMWNGVDIDQKLKVNFSSVSWSMQELITPQSTDSKDYIALKEISVSLTSRKIGRLCEPEAMKEYYKMLSSGYNMVFAVKIS